MFNCWRVDTQRRFQYVNTLVGLENAEEIEFVRNCIHALMHKCTQSGVEKANRKIFDHRNFMETGKNRSNLLFQVSGLRYFALFPESN